MAKRVRRVVGVAARVASKTAGLVRAELSRLEKEGVLSRKDAAALLCLVRRETMAAGKRVARFVTSEVRHEAGLARSLVRVAAERARRASKVLSASPKKSAKKRKR